MKEPRKISSKMATALQQAKETSRKPEVSFTVGSRNHLHVQHNLKGQSSRISGKCHRLTVEPKFTSTCIHKYEVAAENGIPFFISPTLSQRITYNCWQDSLVSGSDLSSATTSSAKLLS